MQNRGRCSHSVPLVGNLEGNFFYTSPQCNFSNDTYPNDITYLRDLEIKTLLKKRFLCKLLTEMNMWWRGVNAVGRRLD